MKGLFIISALVIPVYLMSQSPVLDWIENGQQERVEQYLQENDINSVPAGSNRTLLIHSILREKDGMTPWLIENGADVNLPVEGLSPLMFAAKSGNLKAVRSLVNAGADLEYQDSLGNTALFYAATGGQLRINKFLVRQGADLRHRNHTWQTAYDMAVKEHNSEVAKYLRDQWEKNLPDYLDGPYVRWRGKRSVNAFYMSHDSRSQITRRIRGKFKAEENPFLMEGFAGDTINYLIHSRKETPPDKIEKIDRVMVMGDIHGGYDSLIFFLRQNGVIDSSLGWDWGDGHLVFIGDIFDRGDKVTESLWLIYQLEHQAAQAGGAVHLILGNHEVMILSGNINYLSDKYALMTSKLNIDYSLLFGKRTVLGQWLRTRNSIIKINGHLFVHAGLSPEVSASGMNIHEINDLVRYFLNHPERHEYKDLHRNDLMGRDGPFWYRGYHEGNHEYQHLSEPEFEQILSYFEAEYIFIGHTNVKQITPLYNNRVFAIDVPFYTYGFPIQGLLLENRKVFLLNSSADKKQIR